MDFSTYIMAELGVLIPVLYGLGMIIKHMESISDRFIPLILTVVSIILCTLYVVSTHGFNGLSVFTSFVQGVICSACAVYSNQLYVQAQKVEEK